MKRQTAILGIQVKKFALNLVQRIVQVGPNQSLYCAASFCTILKIH